MFRFANPQYLYLLIAIVPLVLFYLGSLWWKRRAVARYGSPELVRMLASEVSHKKQHAKFLLMLASMTAIVFVMARPQFGAKSETIKRRGIEVVICLDISNSMLSEDVKPSRLDRSKMILSKLLDHLADDRVGLIVFAGNAFTQMPITADGLSAKMFLQSIDPSMISAQGTSVGKAIELAMRSFSPSETTKKSIIIVTDGESHDDDSKGAAELAQQKGFSISVIGVGDPKGAPIPIAGGEYLKDKEGNMVISKLNEQICQEVAALGKGIYARADQTNGAQRALQDHLDTLAKNETEDSVFSEYNEQFQSIIWIALALLLIDFFMLERRNRWFNSETLFSASKAK